MSSDLARWGGLAGVVTGATFVLVGILILVTASQRGSFSSCTDYLIEVILIAAFSGTLVAIAGLHALQRGHYGRLRAAGSSITFIGYAFIVVVAAVGTLAGGEALHNLRLTGGLAVCVGSILLGGMTLRARVLPWWCGVLLMVGFPLGDVLDELVASGGETVALGILWGSVGYALLSRGAVAEQTVRVG